MSEERAGKLFFLYENYDEKKFQFERVHLNFGSELCILYFSLKSIAYI